MPYVLNWSIVATLLALWSFTAWALHAVALWTVSNAGALSGSAAALGAVRLPEELAPWVPAQIAELVSALVSGLAPLVGSLLQAVPALAGGVTVASWVIWGMGSALLVVLGVGVHVLLAVWRRSHGSRSGRPAGRVSFTG